MTTTKDVAYVHTHQADSCTEIVGAHTNRAPRSTQGTSAPSQAPLHEAVVGCAAPYSTHFTSTRASWPAMGRDPSAVLALHCDARPARTCLRTPATMRDLSSTRRASYTRPREGGTGRGTGVGGGVSVGVGVGVGARIEARGGGCSLASRKTTAGRSRGGRERHMCRATLEGVASAAKASGHPQGLGARAAARAGWLAGTTTDGARI